MRFVILVKETSGVLMTIHCFLHPMSLGSVLVPIRSLEYKRADDSPKMALEDGFQSYVSCR
jgi:hypothetical protein